jgi:outer membrane protein assembly factor BamB
VYVAMAYGQVTCYDLEGNLRWMQFLHPAGKDYTPGKDLKQPGQETGHCPSPLLIGDRLIAQGKGYGNGKDGAKNRVVALDKNTGKVLWEVRIGRLTRDVGSPRAVKVNGVDLVVLSNGAILQASDGKILDEDIIKSRGTTISCVATDGNKVYFNWCVTTDGQRDKNFVEASQLDLGTTGLTAKKLWTAAVPNCDRVGPTLANGVIYVGCDRFYTVDEASGTVTELLKEVKEKKCNGNTPPSVVGHHVFWVGGENGKVLVTTAEKDVKIVAANTMCIDVRTDHDRVCKGTMPLDDYLKKYGGDKDRFSTVYAMCGGPFFQGTRMYLRTTEYLYCIAGTNEGN